MAWEGLQETDEFKTKIKDEGLEAEYVEYKRAFEDDNSVNLDCD